MIDINSTYLVFYWRLFYVFCPTFTYVDLLIVWELFKHFTFLKIIGIFRINVVQNVIRRRMYSEKVNVSQGTKIQIDDYFFYFHS